MERTAGKFVAGGALFLAGAFAVGCLQEKRTPARYEIPAGYVGWVRIDFEEPGAAALPTRDGSLVVRFPASGRLGTSTPQRFGWAKDRYFSYSASGVTEILSTGWGGGGMIWAGHTGTGTGGPGRTHECFFVGSEADFGAIGGRPGSAEPTPGSRMVRSE